MTPRPRAEGYWLRATSYGVLFTLIVLAAILATDHSAAGQFPLSRPTDRSPRITARRHVQMVIGWPGLLRLRLRAEVESDLFLLRDSSADTGDGR
jgi:hypothetical protein